MVNVGAACLYIHVECPKYGTAFRPRGGCLGEKKIRSAKAVILEMVCSLEIPMSRHVAVPHVSRAACVCAEFVCFIFVLLLPLGTW